MKTLTNQEVQTFVEQIEVAKPAAKALTKSGMKLSRLFGRTSLVLQKHSPEILLSVGVIGIVGSAILACRATLKAEEVISEHEKKMFNINEAQENMDEEHYSKKDWQRDVTVTYVQTAVDFALLYGPAIILGASSISCIIGAHGIMRKRNVALMAAYKAVEEGFHAYRNRVKEEYGDAKDYMFKHNLYEEEVTEEIVDEDGKKKKVKKTQLVSRDPATGISKYSRVFEKSTTREWSPGDGYNEAYIKSQQAFFNQMLQSRGHVFLNEVYDALGFKRSTEGQIVGWVLDENNNNCIDFGFDNIYWNDIRGDFLLDFNVDGIIYDLI